MATTINELHKAFLEFQRGNEYAMYEPARIGVPSGTTNNKWVTGEDDENVPAGNILVTKMSGNLPGETIMVKPKNITLVPGDDILVRRRPDGGYDCLGMDLDKAAEAWQGMVPTGGKHADTHHISGVDPIPELDTGQIGGIRILFPSNGGLEITVSAGFYRKSDGTFGRVGSQVYDVSSDVPGSLKVWCVISMDDDGVIYSATSSATASLSAADIIGVSVTGQYIGAFPLYAGQTNLDNQREVVDLRTLLDMTGSGAGSGGLVDRPVIRWISL